MIDLSVVGRSFAPVTAHVETGRLRFFFDTLGETNPVYRNDAAAAARASRPSRSRRPTSSAST